MFNFADLQNAPPVNPLSQAEFRSQLGRRLLIQIATTAGLLGAHAILRAHHVHVAVLAVDVVLLVVMAWMVRVVRRQDLMRRRLLALWPDQNMPPVAYEHVATLIPTLGVPLLAYLTLKADQPTSGPMPWIFRAEKTLWITSVAVSVIVGGLAILSFKYTQLLAPTRVSAYAVGDVSGLYLNSVANHVAASMADQRATNAPDLDRTEQLKRSEAALYGMFDRWVNRPSTYEIMNPITYAFPHQTMVTALMATINDGLNQQVVQSFNVKFEDAIARAKRENKPNAQLAIERAYARLNGRPALIARDESNPPSGDDSRSQPLDQE